MWLRRQLDTHVCLSGASQGQKVFDIALESAEKMCAGDQTQVP